MDDIAKRLRSENGVRLAFGQDWSDLLLPAAAEIDSLRNRVAELSAELHEVKCAINPLSSIVPNGETAVRRICALRNRVGKIRDTLSRIADIAHCGGLRGMSEHDALVAIRGLTMGVRTRTDSPEGTRRSGRLATSAASTGEGT